MDNFWTVGMTLDEAEKKIIQYAYRFYDGNKTRTAQSLGIAIRTLDNKLALYGGKTDIQEAQEAVQEIKEHLTSKKNKKGA